MSYRSSRWDDLLATPRPVVAGVCSRLAEESGLPITVIRLAAVLCCVLPTGLAYLLVAWLARSPYRRVGSGAGSRAVGALRPDLLRLRERFGVLEPRLAAMEAMVTSREFELRRGFRRMGE